MYPKIGIRPIIDGRQFGIRESLEKQTSDMAEAAKKLIEENVFYSDGTPVQCVISPSTIGGGAESAKSEEYFSTQNVCATLSVTPCWCYGSETMDLNPPDYQGCVGLQRNGASRSCLPCGSYGTSCPEGTSCIFNLRSRRSGR